MSHIIWFNDTRKEDVPRVGGKAANLGELLSAGIPAPPGFTVPAQTYMEFILSTGLEAQITEALSGLDVNHSTELTLVAEHIQRLIIQAPMPASVEHDIRRAYRQLGAHDHAVAVRSSATAEDLPEDSFAGQQATFLNVNGQDNVVRAVQACWASLFEARAIFYRVEKGYDHMQVALAVVVQQMVQSAKAGVMFTINSLTGNPGQIEISAGYGLGEAVVSGQIDPDTYILSKQPLAVIERSIASQDKMLVRTTEHGGSHDDANQWVNVEQYLVDAPKITDEQIIKLAEVGMRVEQHYGSPQDMEWAIDATGNIFLTQARPVTIKSVDYAVEDKALPKETADILVSGQPASPGVATGKVVILEGPHQCDLIEPGDILVAEMTTPDYVPAMKRAGAIVTDRGGRTCHAAIVARELGKPAIVGTHLATKNLTGGDTVTVDGSHGDVFQGLAATRVDWWTDRQAQLTAKKLEMANVSTRTKVMAILAAPDEAAKVASENVDGVGLLRMEFILAHIGKHPKAFLAEGKGEEFIAQLVDGFTAFCEPFGDRPVVLRLTDFKTNELSNLIGGSDYEVSEENPMLGLRGAARYMQQPEVFALEVEAIRRVREQFTNLYVMVPFVRTPGELKWVINFLAEHGVSQEDGLKIWMMAEVPSNLILLEEFIEAGLDGVSIGSNDLTQLILGIDRDNERLIGIGDERDPAVMHALETIVRTGRSKGITVGICGQAPSDHPEITQKLVEWGATSISVTPDRITQTREIVHHAEASLHAQGELDLS